MKATFIILAVVVAIVVFAVLRRSSGSRSTAAADTVPVRTGPKNPELEAAHRHSSLHRDVILRSEQCGCFYCLAVFPPSRIVEWCDTHAGVQQTALCPECGIDSVIGSASGVALTPEFLARMKKHWF